MNKDELIEQMFPNDEEFQCLTDQTINGLNKEWMTMFLGLDEEHQILMHQSMTQIVTVISVLKATGDI